MKTPTAITEFSGRHSYLSNFHPSTVYILIGTKWVKCPTVEHGYQASKTVSQHHRRRIVDASTPGEAKRMGQNVRRVSYWDEVKTIIMLELLRQKFSHSVLAERLIKTGDAKLIEGNHWHDNFWGVCSCDGCCEKFKTTSIDTTAQNWLGRLLVRVRKDIR